MSIEGGRTGVGGRHTATGHGEAVTGIPAAAVCALIRAVSRIPATRWLEAGLVLCWPLAAFLQWIEVLPDGRLWLLGSAAAGGAACSARLGWLKRKGRREWNATRGRMGRSRIDAERLQEWAAWRDDMDEWRDDWDHAMRSIFRAAGMQPPRPARRGHLSAVWERSTP